MHSRFIPSTLDTQKNNKPSYQFSANHKKCAFYIASSKQSTMKSILASFLALLALPNSTLATVGGRCSNNWGADCICLDKTVCQNTWKGVAYTGTPGNYPCPADPNNVMACIIRPCPGKPKSGTTQCLWTEACGQLTGSKCFHPSNNRIVSLSLYHNANPGD